MSAPKPGFQKQAAQIRAAKIRLMAFDVDGVLTDGSLYFSDHGEMMKNFSAKDGQGLRFLQHGGVHLAIITGRQSGAVDQRAQDLNIALVLQKVMDKKTALQNLAEDHGLSFEQCGYMGDDVVDLPVMMACGFCAAPADAVQEVVDRAHFVSRFGGGRGAVREVCEFILNAQGQWSDIVACHVPDLSVGG